MTTIDTMLALKLVDATALEYASRVINCIVIIRADTYIIGADRKVPKTMVAAI